MNVFKLFLLLNITLGTKTFGQVEKLIPTNWKVAQKIESDFNIDGFPDLFIVIDSMDTKNTWLCAKRDLLIFHGSQNGLSLVDKNTLLFLDRNKLVDADMIQLSVKDNKVNISIVDMNWNGGYKGGMEYTFRFQNGKWIVIGCNMSGERLTTNDNDQEVMRKEIFSYNFVTGKYEREIKLDSKTTKRKTKKKLVRLYLFSQYNGDCDE